MICLDHKKLMLNFFKLFPAVMGLRRNCKRHSFGDLVWGLYFFSRNCMDIRFMFYPNSKFLPTVKLGFLVNVMEFTIVPAYLLNSHKNN